MIVALMVARCKGGLFLPWGCSCLALYTPFACCMMWPGTVQRRKEGTHIDLWHDIYNPECGVPHPHKSQA